MSELLQTIVKELPVENDNNNEFEHKEEASILKSMEFDVGHGENNEETLIKEEGTKSEGSFQSALDEQKMMDLKRHEVEQRMLWMEKVIRKSAEGQEIQSQWFPYTNQGLDEKLAKETREMVYERMTSTLLTGLEFDKLIDVLLKYANLGPPTISKCKWKKIEFKLRENGDLMHADYIDFFYYTKAINELGPRYKGMLTGNLFISLLKDAEPQAQRMFRIPIDMIFRYVFTKISNKRYRLMLFGYDEKANGQISENAMVAFLHDFEQLKPRLDMIPSAYHPVYLCMVVRRFFFFLDQKQKDKIKITDILASQLIREILEPPQNLLNEVVVDWFSPRTVFHVENHFMELDEEKQGGLTKEQFIKFDLALCFPGISGTKLTQTFVDLLYSEIEMQNNKLDFKPFVDFVIAMIYINEEQAVMYFMRILDWKKKGFLNVFDLHFFYKDIEKRYGTDAPKFSDVKDEIFDMVKPQDSLKITAKDLINSGCAATVIRLLIDVNGFGKYETREDEAGSQLDPPLPLPEIKQIVQDLLAQAQQDQSESKYMEPEKSYEK